MEHSKIKNLLATAGITQLEIAKKVGVSKFFVSKVINGKKSSYKVQKAIAEALGKSVEELWRDDGRSGDTNKGENGKYSNKSADQLTPNQKNEIWVTPNEYYKLNSEHLKISRQTFYRRLLSDRNVEIDIDFNSRRKRYLIRVVDPKMIERIRLARITEALIKRERKGKGIVELRVKIPAYLERKLEAIHSPPLSFFYYEKFYDFINKGDLIFELKKSGEQNYIRKKIKISPEYFRNISQLAEINQISIGKVLEIALKNFEFDKINSGENHYENTVKLGKSQ